MKCKGTHKDTYGLGCKQESNSRKLGLCTDVNRCYQKFLTTTEKGKKRISRLAVKVSKKRIESEEDLQKGFEEKKRRQNLSTLLESVKTVCHTYIKLRDKHKPCISCQQPWHKDHQAGHFYKSELFSTIRFNELNINGQCVKCNIRKEGNESEYRVNLPNRIGLEKFAEINFLASIDKRTDHKWQREELKQIRDYYKQKTKQLKTMQNEY